VIVAAIKAEWRKGSLHRRAVVVVTGLLTLGGVSACGSDDDGPVGPDMTRIAYARAYQNGKFTVPHQTPADVGKALAGLEPTWVTGVIRLRISDVPTSEEVSGYETIRDAVHEKAADAEFGVELNALDYTTPSAVTDKMSEVRGKLDNDGWFFDFFTPAYDKRPAVVEAAIADAHDHGEFVGGNTFGWSKDPEHPVIPPGTDFLGIADDNFKLDLSAVRTLAGQVPVVFHLRNNPGKASSEGCVYINDYSTGRRETYVRRRASEQKESDFHFAYPVFFPSCEPRSKGHDIQSFDAIDDSSMLKTLGELMDRYN
jgi:hypothetical protein